MSETMMAFEANKKSVGLAYALWFFLGGFSAHRFYSGKIGSAIAQLLLGVTSFIMVFLAIGGTVAAAASGNQAAAEGAGGLLIFAGLVWVVTGIWLLVDAFLINGWIKRHNMNLAQSLSATAPLNPAG